jgi:hypothetical protein
VAIEHRIDALYTQHPFYGSRRITAQLRREGMTINRKVVQRHMREEEVYLRDDTSPREARRGLGDYFLG